MNRQMLPGINRVTTILSFVIVGLTVSSLSAQETLTIESISVENGATNVPLVSDYRITFSSAISTIGLPDIGLDGLPIDLDLTNDDCPATPALVFFSPEGCPPSWSLEDDGRTLVLEQVPISEDQITTMIVLFAISTDGALLDRPYSVRFTSQSEIPQGSISGTVTSDVVDVNGSIVAVVPGCDYRHPRVRRHYQRRSRYGVCRRQWGV